MVGHESGGGGHINPGQRLVTWLGTACSPEVARRCLRGWLWIGVRLEWWQHERQARQQAWLQTSSSFDAARLAAPFLFTPQQPLCLSDSFYRTLRYVGTTLGACPGLVAFKGHKHKYQQNPTQKTSPPPSQPQPPTGECAPPATADVLPLLPWSCCFISSFSCFLCPRPRPSSPSLPSSPPPTLTARAPLHPRASPCVPL